MNLRTARFALVAAFALAALCFVTPTYADDEEQDVVGVADFEFGQKLAAEGRRTGDKFYFAYARRVYQDVLESGERSKGVKDLARYGLAELDSEAAMGAMARPIPYKDVVQLLRDACDALEDFAKKYPKHPRANDAKLKVGTTRLGFVQWARDTVLPDQDLMAERGTDETEVARDAKSFVGTAINHFDKLRVGHDVRPPKTPTVLSQLAQYYWVLSQHYQALVLDRCSSHAMEAFGLAERHLDDFTMMNDGTLVGVYALNILGLNWVEKAKCESDEKEQAQAYQMALQQFGACMDTPYESPDHLKVITHGFYNFAHTCRQAGRLDGFDFLRLGVERVSPMLEIQPQAWRAANGVRALIELGLLHAEREHVDKAVETLTLAADMAKKSGNGYLERKANAELKITLSKSGGGNADPEVLKRVADAFYAEERWAEAANAYKQVVGSAPRTEAAYKAYVAESWTRMSSAFLKMGDLLGAALARDPLHEAWVDGIFSNNGTPTDPNMLEMGNQRYNAIALWRKLADVTGSRAYEKRATDMLRDFKRDYPGHPRGAQGMWRTAHGAFTTALKMKREKKPGWKKELAKAESGFREVATDAKSPDQHKAWVYLIRCAHTRGSAADKVKVGKEALAYWDSDAMKEQAKQFASRRTEIHSARGQVRYWLSDAYADQGKWDEVLAVLNGFHADHEELKGNKIYYSGAYDNLIQAYLGKDDITTANQYLDKLLRFDPGYFNLPSITKRLATFFDNRAKGMVEKLSALYAEEATLKPEVKIGESKEFAMLDRRSNVRARIAKAKEAVALWEESLTGNVDVAGLTETQYEKFRDSIPPAEKELAELQKRINAHGAELAKKRNRLTEVLDAKEKLQEDLYTPRVKAAGYFYQLYKALIEAGKTPYPSNVKAFGDKYRVAARLGDVRAARRGVTRPKEETPEQKAKREALEAEQDAENRQNWDRARELYESYVKMKGAEPEKVQEVTGYLGRIYYRLATWTDDEKQRNEFVELARERLQAALAKVPENTALVLGQIAGEYGVLNWQGEQFLLPRGVDSVDKLRRMVEGLGTAAVKVPLPAFATPAATNRYKSTLDKFKFHVKNVLTDRDLKKTVKSLERPTLDPRFYAKYATISPDFRSALAWVWAVSGEEGDAQKAAALATGLVHGPLAVQEGSEDWWFARVIRLEAVVGWAESISGKASGKGLARDLIERASKDLSGITRYPSLGKRDRPGTPEELQGLLERITKQRRVLNLKPLLLTLKAKDPVGDDLDEEGK